MSQTHSPTSAALLPLPHLRNLNLSYSHLRSEGAASLLLSRAALHTLTLNGCEGLTAALWPLLHHSRQHLQNPQARTTRIFGAGRDSDNRGTPSFLDLAHAHLEDGGSNLQSLTLVKCGKLSSLCLGLLPGPGCVLLNRPPCQQWATVEMSEVEKEVSLNPYPTVVWVFPVCKCMGKPEGRSSLTITQV